MYDAEKNLHPENYSTNTYKEEAMDIVEAIKDDFIADEIIEMFVYLGRIKEKIKHE